MTTPTDDIGRPVLQRETASKREALVENASAASLGIEMGLAVLIGALIGRWLDGRFDSEPLWTIVFLCVGIAAAFKGLIRVARAHQRHLRAAAEDLNARPGGAGAPEPDLASEPSTRAS